MVIDRVERPEDWDPVRRFAHAIIRYRIWVLGVTLILTAAAAFGLTRLTYNPDTRIFLGHDNPQRLAMEHIEQTYTSANTLVIIVESQSGDIFSRRVLQLLQDLTEQAWLIPHAFQVRSIANHQHQSVNGDDIRIETLYQDTSQLTDENLMTIRDRALEPGSGLERLVSPDGSVATVHILVHPPDDEKTTAIPEIAQSVRTLAGRMADAYPEVRIRLSGGVIGDMTFAEASMQDTRTLIPLMILVIAVTLTLSLRTLTGMLVTLGIVGLSAIISMGIGGYLGFLINAATSGAPVIIMTLAIADCIHLLVTVAHCRRQGRAPQEAIVEALRINFTPIAITSLTTALGFLSLNFSESPPLRELGILVAVGTIAAYLLSVTALPALLSLFPAMQIPPYATPASAMRRLADFAIDRRGILTLVFILAIPALATGIYRLQVDDDFVAYFDSSFDFRRDTDFMERRINGLHVLQFSLPSGDSQGIAQPDYLRQVDAFTEWLGDQDHVSTVLSISQPLKQINRILNQDDPAFERLPESRQLAAQLLIFLEMALPPGIDLSDAVDVDRSRSLMTAYLRGASSSDIRALAEASENWLHQNTPDLFTPAAGISVAYAYITERNIEAMLRGTIFALIALSLILLLYLRSVRIGLISLLPNLIPAAMAFGLWGYLQGEVNLAISIVGAMTLGIVVDDSVHFLSKYMRARRELQLSPRDAIRETFVLVGPALIMTSATLLLGFLVLSMSGFAISSQTGLMSAIIISIALIADLLFLPALLLRFDKSAADAEPAHE